MFLSNNPNIRSFNLSKIGKISNFFVDYLHATSCMEANTNALMFAKTFFFENVLSSHHSVSATF